MAFSIFTFPSLYVYSIHMIVIVYKFFVDKVLKHTTFKGQERLILPKQISAPICLWSSHIREVQ